MVITGVDLSRTTFTNDFKKLPQDVKLEATKKINGLIGCAINQIPRAYRFHSLSGYRPTVYSIDITTNKAYKATFELDGCVARFRRIGTHKSISRTP